MKKRPLILRIILWLAAAGIACYAGLVGLVYYWEVTMPEPADYDCIIVLGAQVKDTGEPSVQLRWRLDKAKEYYAKKPCPIVVCGGQGADEPAPEGDVMRGLLIAEGLDENLVLSDPDSKNTRQNLANARKLLEPLGCRKPLVVTSDYHLKRAMALARDLGMDPEGAGSPCRSEVPYWLKNHLREALSWMKYWAEKALGRTL